MDTTPKYTTAMAATILGVTVASARRIRQDKGVGVKLGRDWLLSDADIEAMRDRDTTPGPKRKTPAPSEEERG